MVRYFKTLLTTIMVVTALSLNVSCCKHKVTERPEIKLNCFSMGTKAIVENKQSLITQSYNEGGSPIGFGVFGYKTSSSSAIKLFDNTEVLPSSSGINTTWYYSPIRYWDSDPTVSYQFAAYWPILSKTAGGGPYVAEENKQLTINNIPNWQEGSVAADYLIAAKRGHYAVTTGTPDFIDGMVNLNFNHILAQLVINGFYTGILDTHIFVKSIVLNKGAGTDFLSPIGAANYVYPFSGDGSDAFTGVTMGSASHTLFSSAEGLEILNPAFKDETIADPEYVPQNISTWLMVPAHGWNNLSLDVVYKIGLDGIDRQSTITSLTINSGDGYPAQTQSGKSYILNLKFNSAGDGITLEAVFINDWITAPDVNVPVYNW